MITKLILPNTDFNKLCEEKEKEKETLSKTKEYKKARECYDWLWMQSLPDDINIEMIQSCILIIFIPLFIAFVLSIPSITQSWSKTDPTERIVLSIMTVLIIVGIIQAALFFIIRYFKRRKYRKIVVDYCESIGKIDTPVDEVFGYRKPIIPYKNVAELLLKWSLVAGASYATKREEGSKTVTVYLCTNDGNNIIDSFCIEPKRHMSELFSKVDEGCLDFTFIDSLIQEEKE